MYRSRTLGTILRGVAAAFLVAVMGVAGSGCSSSGEDVVGGEDSVVTTLPSVSVTTADRSILEAGSPAQFVITLNETTPVDLEINFRLGGNAQIGDDYTSDYTSMVVIPTGSNSATVTIAPIDDGPGETTESVSFTLIASDGYTLGDNDSALVNIVEDHGEVFISVRAVGSPVNEDGGDTGQFIIELSEMTPVELEVPFDLSGTAVLDSDYDVDATMMITIPANGDSAIVTITPVDDGLGEGTETVIIALVIPGGYVGGEATAATVEILDSSGFSDFVLTDLDIRFKSIQPGTFMMSSPASEPFRMNDEGVRHEVTITKPFWMADAETTIDQFRAFLLDEESYSIIDRTEGVNFSEASCPINNDETYSLIGRRFGVTGDQPILWVSYIASTNFCIWLTERETRAGSIPSGYEYRLPTEAEWEYCCRAGSTTAFHYGEDIALDLEGVIYRDLADYAWYRDQDTGDYRTQSIRTKRPNDWGLYDMHGNVWEWCYNWKGRFTSEPQVDPIGPATANSLAIRSGSWHDPGFACRSSNRTGGSMTFTEGDLGFRVVLASILPRQR